LGLFGFEPKTRRMRLEAVYPGVTVEQVRDHTPFDLLVADQVLTAASPSDRELEILRALDPDRQFIG
jgi:glutaconate CoA-transferase subunit B